MKEMHDMPTIIWKGPIQVNGSDQSLHTDN